MVPCKMSSGDDKQFNIIKADKKKRKMQKGEKVRVARVCYSLHLNTISTLTAHTSTMIASQRNMSFSWSHLSLDHLLRMAQSHAALRVL